MRTLGTMHRGARAVLKAALAGAAVTAMIIAADGPMLAGAAPARGTKATKTAAPDNADRTPIDINAADAEKLATLPGIGPSIAQRIVDYRKEHGPFKSVDELVNVRGVGEKLLGRLRDHVTVGGTKD